ncbi:hypothetical protein ACIQZB_25430 [Streptomyces sp. NPDC097727]|uniref:hypothetical protein n=1 Tax=Streptomyces sp. NPDC097727 TaxID=3366092 RepID=UPI0038030017
MSDRALRPRPVRCRRYAAGSCHGEADALGNLGLALVEVGRLDDDAVGRRGGFFRGSGQTESAAFSTVRHDTLYLRSSSRVFMPAR